MLESFDEHSTATEPAALKTDIISLKVIEALVDQVSESVIDFILDELLEEPYLEPVSYTHLTLPTIYSV